MVRFEKFQLWCVQGVLLHLPSGSFAFRFSPALFGRPMLKTKCLVTYISANTGSFFKIQLPQRSGYPPRQNTCVDCVLIRPGYCKPRCKQTVSMLLKSNFDTKIKILPVNYIKNRLQIQIPHESKRVGGNFHANLKQFFFGKIFEVRKNYRNQRL